jgi:hypothetical protein
MSPLHSSINVGINLSGVSYRKKKKKPLRSKVLLAAVLSLLTLLASTIEKHDVSAGGIKWVGRMGWEGEGEGGGTR